MFSSIESRDIPYRVGQTVSVIGKSAMGTLIMREIEQSNPPNPILTHYRARAHRWTIDGYVQSLSPELVWQWDGIATAEQVRHARAVLTRLAALS